MQPTTQNSYRLQRRKMVQEQMLKNRNQLGRPASTQESQPHSIL